MQPDVLQWAFLYHYHTDKANACVHCAPVRFSPITFRLYVALAEDWPREQDILPEMAEVREHSGKYEQDKGR